MSDNTFSKDKFSAQRAGAIHFFHCCASRRHPIYALLLLCPHLSTIDRTNCHAMGAAPNNSTSPLPPKNFDRRQGISSCLHETTQVVNVMALYFELLKICPSCKPTIDMSTFILGHTCTNKTGQYLRFSQQNFTSCTIPNSKPASVQHYSRGCSIFHYRIMAFSQHPLLRVSIPDRSA